MFASNIKEKLAEIINGSMNCCRFGFALEAAVEVQLVEQDHDNVVLSIFYDKDDLYAMACRELLCTPRHLAELRAALAIHLGYNPNIHLRVTEPATDNVLIATQLTN